MSERRDQQMRAEMLADNLLECGHEDISAIDLLDCLASCGLHLEEGGRVAIDAYVESLREDQRRVEARVGPDQTS